jgi:hypothetical protein
MVELVSWWRSASDRFTKPWLLLGKGPTFDAYDENQTSFCTFGLNHVVKLKRINIAHAIDIEVVCDCERQLDGNCDFLIMPYIPNVRFQSGGKPLDAYFDLIPALREFAYSDRLVWYNLVSGGRARINPTVPSPLITANFFSAEAAVDILGTLGANTVYTLGIDGGTNYASTVSASSPKTLLANGQPSFDLQFNEISKTSIKHKIKVVPMIKPMKIFVGTDESQMVAAKVLEHSIKSRASGPVVVTHMLNLNYPKLTNPKIKVGTGFSFARFKIPELCNYDGIAMYCDADMQVFADVSELWNQKFGDQTVLCTRQDYIPDVWKNNPAFTPGRQMSVMMLDCNRLDWRIESIIEGLNREKYTYKQLLADLCIVPSSCIRDDVNSAWNSLEHYEAGITKLLHYTNVPTQPWKTIDNPLTEIWEREFCDAIRHGAVTLELLTDSILKGYVRSDLLDLAMGHFPVDELCESNDALAATRNILWDAIQHIRDLTSQLESSNLRIRTIESSRVYRVIKKVKRIIKRK